MDVERLVQEEEAMWTAFLDVLERVPQHRVEEPGVTPDGWSPKDVMFHVGAWLEDCGGVLERMHDGAFNREAEPDGRGTIDGINRKVFARSRATAVGDVRASLEHGRVRAVRAFRSLEDVTPEAWEWFEESGPLHYEEHIRDIEAWLER
jgi:hypothetical protein